jgi:hypothetical protein
MLLSFKHFTSASKIFYCGSLTAVPIQIQADIRTFQKLSFNSYINLLIIFFFGF